ncbi:MarR family winged helix-turn-helix transcriptional regulator [Cryptosporangium sp. NPDC048952]|uniref:MarR family winged helix-turn-helix transcriptional regulator n=1 Tax=Cryptosporangium sp. NPDC048952 TaxID=3363961 RepID=UPI00371287B5
MGLHDAVDPAAYPVLSGIDRYGPSTAAALGHRIGLDRSIVSRRAARLTAAGLVSAAPDASDARAVILTLTEPGAAIVDVMRQRLASAIDERLADWDEADRDAFAALLHRFVAEGPLRQPGGRVTDPASRSNRDGRASQTAAPSSEHA